MQLHFRTPTLFAAALPLSLILSVAQSDAQESPALHEQADSSPHDGPAISGALPTGVRQMFDHSSRRMLERTVSGQLSLIDESDGLLVQAGLSFVGQYASESLTDRQGLMTFTYDVAGALRFFEDTGAGQGLLSWWVRGGRPIGASTEDDLSADIGSTFGVNTLLLNDAVFINELYWLHSFGGIVDVSIGRIDPYYRYDFNNVANDEREQFLAFPLVNSPGIALPEPGLGLDVGWNVSDFLFLQAGVYQSNGSLTAARLDRLRADELFWAIEATLQPDFEGLGGGNYRFLLYYTDSDGAEGPGFSLSFDQEIGGGVVPFFRFSIADPDITAFEKFLSAGVGFEDPFGRAGEMFGLGWSWADPTADGARDEQLIEAFYRFEINEFLAVSPDLQFVINPSDNPQEDLIIVVGVRVQASF